MNFQFREEVFRAGFRPSADVDEFETRLRGKLGLKSKYESARLSMGRSLTEPKPPTPLSGDVERGKAISGDMLFGSERDLWIAAVVLDGELGAEATIEDFRVLVEAHWARGGRLLRDELASVADDESRLMARLAELLPTDTRLQHSLSPSGFPVGRSGEIRLRVGSVSTSVPDGRPLDFVLNGQATSPHFALIGKVGSGKTTTGIQIARQIVEQTGVPFLFFNPKGDFIENGQLSGPLADFHPPARLIEVGQEPIPLDFLPGPGVGSASITQAAMQFRDSIALCCKSVGNIQQDVLRRAVEDVIRLEEARDLGVIRAHYEAQLAQAGKAADSVVSRLNEVTALRVFTPTMSARNFFAQSWILGLNTLASEELKRLVILLVLDALKSFVLSQPDTAVDGGFRALRHFLIIDEARRILAQERYQSLVDLVRQGRSKGEVVMLLSQDPSDFEGKADDFMTQLGAMIAFACAQGQRGLRSLQGPFGRKLQPQEFADTHLPPGVALVKLPGRVAERVQCWTPLSPDRA